MLLNVYAAVALGIVVLAISVKVAAIINLS
jgi:hypothetical protein